MKEENKQKIIYVNKRELEISSGEMLDILTYCEKNTFFGDKHYLYGTALQIKEDKEFYMRKMIDEAYRLGYEKGRLNK